MSKKKTFSEVCNLFCEKHKPRNVYKFCKLISGDPESKLVKDEIRYYSSVDLTNLRYEAVISNDEKEVISFLHNFDKELQKTISSGSFGGKCNIFCSGAYYNSMIITDIERKEQICLAIIDGVFIIKQRFEPIFSPHAYEFNVYIIKKNPIIYNK